MMLPPRRRKEPARPPAPFSLQTPVSWLSPKDELTLGQCCEGVMVFGATGSGKSSGIADTIIPGLLRLGCGALWLCAKPGEYQHALALARATGRESDVVRFAPGERWTFDVVGEEITAPGGGVESAAQLIDTLLRLAQRNAAGGGDEPFWAALASRIIRMSLCVARAATGTASMGLVDQIVASAPQSREAADSPALDQESLCARLILHAKLLDLTPPERRDLDHAAQFFLSEWVALADKTRSIGQTMVQNITSRFVTGPLADLVSSGSSNLPSVCDGAIVVADMAVLTHRELGQFFGCLLKQSIARQVLRREVTDDLRPVVIIADEAQLFCDPEQDAMTQTVARQSRLISLALTQSLPTLYSSAGGGDKAKQAMDSWIGNHQTKLVCASGCAETNRFFEAAFGMEWRRSFSGSTNTQGFDLMADMMGQQSVTVSGGWHEQWLPALPAHEFTRLAKGGPAFGCRVEAYAFQGGRVWSNGKTFMKVTFDQRKS